MQIKPTGTLTLAAFKCVRAATFADIAIRILAELISRSHIPQIAHPGWHLADAASGMAALLALPLIFFVIVFFATKQWRLLLQSSIALAFALIGSVEFVRLSTVN